MNTIKPPEIAIRTYAAILNQSGTDAPVATVLHNTLDGEIVWTRTGAGAYVGTLTGQFPVNKMTIIANILNIPPNKKISSGINNSPDSVLLYQTGAASPYTAQDNMVNAWVEIKVYNNN